MSYSSYDKEADALKKRITRNNPDLTPAPIPGIQGRVYYAVERMIACFQAEKSIGLTDGQIATSIRARGLPEEAIVAPTRTKAGQSVWHWIKPLVHGAKTIENGIGELVHRFRQVASAWLNGRLAKPPAVGIGMWADLLVENL